MEPTVIELQTVKELQNVCSKLGDANSTLGAIDSTTVDVHSVVRDVELKVADVQSNLRTLDTTLGDVNAKVRDANNLLQGIHSALDDIKSSLRNRGDYSWFWFFLLIGLFFENWAGSKLDRFTDRVWYSMKYTTSWSNVDIQRRPSDCDFLHAPMGAKRCSYQKDKMVFGDEERQKWMAQGQTQDEKIEISKRPNTVTVYWMKNEEP